jgi:hypothetical protein
MKTIRRVTVAIALALIAVPAQAAENIACMDAGYTTEDMATLERHSAALTMDRLSGGAPQEVISIIATRAGDCADANGWSPDAISDAVLYRSAQFLRTSLARVGPMTPAQLARFDRAVAAADQSRLRRIFGQIERNATNERPPEQGINNSDAEFLGRIFMSSGMPMNQQFAEFGGALIAARMLGLTAQERFATR